MAPTESSISSDKATAAWWNVASVRGWAPKLDGDDDALDYPLKALPACEIEDVDRFRAESAAIATGLWLHYNWRTIQGEERIAVPALDLLTSSSSLSASAKEGMLQTAVDEKFHTYMHTLAMREAEKRYTRRFDFADSITVRELEAALAAEPEAWKRNLVRIAYAVVAEISVNAFLEILSRSSDIREGNRSLVDRHNRDERFHTVLFLRAARELLRHESAATASFLRAQIKGARLSFLKHDVQMYRRVFAAHEVPVRFGESLGLMTRDMSGIDRLMDAVDE